MKKALNNQSIFDTSLLGSDLKKRSLQGGAVTVSSQGLKLVLSLGSTMILARILTPNDYGVMAMVGAITGFASLFLNLGLSVATVQRAEINHIQVSTLFWINAGMGVLLMLMVAGLSPAVAWFYDNHELTWVALAMSVVFLFNGLAVQHNALLNRQMRFFAMAVIQVVALIFGILVAIFAALQGLGYWALVLNQIAISFFTLLATWLSVGWIPGLPRRNAGVRPMIMFGSGLVGFNIVNYFARNLDNILIGRFHGSGALGFYDKAYQLLMMPIRNLRDPMNRVAMPALSRLQNEPENYRNYYMKFVSILAFVSMPLVTFLFVCSDQIINIILGPQWGESVELFRILALVAFIQPVASTRGLVLISKGRTRRYFILGVAGAVVMCLSFVVGLPWGAKGVATGYAVGVYIGLFPFLYFSFMGTPVSLFDFLKAVYKPFLSSLVMGLFIYFLVVNLHTLNDIVLICISLLASIFLYILATVIISNGKSDISEYVAYGKIVISKG